MRRGAHFAPLPLAAGVYAEVSLVLSVEIEFGKTVTTVQIYRSSGPGAQRSKRTRVDCMYFDTAHVGPQMGHGAMLRTIGELLTTMDPPPWQPPADEPKLF